MNILRRIWGRSGVPVPYRWSPDPMARLMLMGYPGYNQEQKLVHQWPPGPLEPYDAPAICEYVGESLPLPDLGAQVCPLCWTPAQVMEFNDMHIEQLTWGRRP